MDDYKIIQEQERNGFKVISYIKELTDEERQNQDEKLSREAIGIVRDHIDKK
jgi:hypothetical protein